MLAAIRQDKKKEIAFFNRHADADEYDVFTPQANARLVDAFVRLTELPPGSRVADLGCGSGVFTNLLHERGYAITGVDISPKLIQVGKIKFPHLDLVDGDIEHLPFATESLDGALLSGVLHHLPDPRRCAEELFRVLRPGGRFVAFDPNRLNPFMWLYRDRSSPFYSATGVTENERPILAREAAEVFRQGGFEVTTDYLGGMAYRYVASPLIRALRPIYNAIDHLIARISPLRQIRPFVLTTGVKPTRNVAAEPLVGAEVSGETEDAGGAHLAEGR